MRTGLFLISFSVFVIVSCGSKDTIPADVLPKEKMQAVLWDVMRADQFLSDYVFSKDTATDKKKESEKMYAKILSLHKISWDEFRRSFDWYSHHPEMLKPIMDSIAAVPAVALPPVVQPPVTAPSQSVIPQGTDTTILAGKPVPQKDTTKRRRSKLPGKPLRMESY